MSGDSAALSSLTESQLHWDVVYRLERQVGRATSGGMVLRFRTTVRTTKASLNVPADTVPPFIESVVHPTDFSPASERAFAHALAIALLRRARLEILHVDADDRPDWSEFPAVRAVLERWGLLEPGSSRGAVFEKLSMKVTKRAISGRFPALAVVDYLDGAPADLLVVATEGRDGAARWLHGSVAEAMARRSRTMTLFVPAHAERSFVSLADGTLTLNNVLVPVDHTPDASAAVEFARRAAEIGGDGKTTISLLHVGAETAMPRLRAEDGPRWTFARMRREGEPVTEILAAAELVRADLIVMPTAGRAGVFEVLRGSTTEQVLRKAHCPLLAVPASSGT